MNAQTTHHAAAAGQAPPAIDPARPASMAARLRRTSRGVRVFLRQQRLRLGIQAAAVVLAILAWLFIIPALGVPSYLWPSLPDVISAFKLNFISLPLDRGLMAPGTGAYDTLQTLSSALLGYAIGAGSAMALAILASEFKLLGHIIQPFISALQSLPKIALAPLFLVWFGFGMSGHVALVVSLVIFPVMLNAYSGLTLVPEDYLELTRSLRTKPWRTLLLVKLPASLPSLFTGLNVGIVYALLAAIVSEFLSGQTGLGAELVLAQSSSNTPGVFAILVVLGILGALLNGIVAFIGRRIVFWGGKR